MRVVIGIIIGGAIGFGLGYFGKCTSGACPLIGNPIISMVIGALIGAMIALAK